MPTDKFLFKRPAGLTAEQAPIYDKAEALMRSWLDIYYTAETAFDDAAAFFVALTTLEKYFRNKYGYSIPDSTPRDVN